MEEDKERLLSRLKKWTAEGFRLRPDTTHMYMEGSLLQADMMKIDKKAHYWSCFSRSWQEYESQLNPPRVFATVFAQRSRAGRVPVTFGHPTTAET